MVSKKGVNQFVYEFLSPITVEESFMIEEQDYYVNDISTDLFNKIKFIINDYMNSLKEEGIACFLDDFLKPLINKIYIYPEKIDNKLYCHTIIIANKELSPINKGILLDFLEDEFMNGFGSQISQIDIICDINNIDYYNKIFKYLQINNIAYSVRLNFYNYNNFFIKKL